MLEDTGAVSEVSVDEWLGEQVSPGPPQLYTEEMLVESGDVEEIPVGVEEAAGVDTTPEVEPVGRLVLPDIGAVSEVSVKGILNEHNGPYVQVHVELLGKSVVEEDSMIAVDECSAEELRSELVLGTGAKEEISENPVVDGVGTRELEIGKLPVGVQE